MQGTLFTKFMFNQNYGKILFVNVYSWLGKRTALVRKHNIDSHIKGRKIAHCFEISLNHIGEVSQSVMHTNEHAPIFRGFVNTVLERMKAHIQCMTLKGGDMDDGNAPELASCARKTLNVSINSSYKKVDRKGKEWHWVFWRVRKMWEKSEVRFAIVLSHAWCGDELLEWTDVTQACWNR